MRCFGTNPGVRFSPPKFDPTPLFRDLDPITDFEELSEELIDGEVVPDAIEDIFRCARTSSTISFLSHSCDDMSDLNLSQENLEALASVYEKYQNKGLYASYEEFSEYIAGDIPQRLLNNGNLLQRQFGQDLIIATGGQYAVQSTAYEVDDGSRYEPEDGVVVSAEHDLGTSEPELREPEEGGDADISTEEVLKEIDALFMASAEQMALLLQELPPLKYLMLCNARASIQRVGGPSAERIQTLLVERILAPVMNAAGITEVKLQPAIPDPYVGQNRDVHLQDLLDQVAWGRSNLMNQTLGIPVVEDPT